MIEQQDVTIELRRVTYEQEAVVVSLIVTNAGTQKLAINPSGVLLDYEDLTYPLAADASDLPLAMAPGSESQLTFRFRLGRPMSRPARLGLRSVHREGHQLAPLHLEIPRPPSVDVR